MEQLAKCLCLSLPLLLLFGRSASAEGNEITPNKAAFNLFNPTPLDFMRPMTVDGPGATESPYTVDAGHFQLEMTMVAYTSYEEPSPPFVHRLDVWTVGPINLKLGLLNSLDFQLVLEPHNHVFEREGALRETRRGFGDTAVRFKYNLWGNDAGTTALALIPHLAFPTAAEGLGNEHVEGGLLVPAYSGLPCNFHLGATSGFASVENVLSSGRSVEFRNSIALAHELFWDLEAYVEFFSSVSTERGAGWVGTFDSGLTYWLAEDLELSAGFNVGVTSWADDWHGFLSMAWRY